MARTTHCMAHLSLEYKGFEWQLAENLESKVEIIVQGGAPQKRDLVGTTYHASANLGTNSAKQASLPTSWGIHWQGDSKRS